MQTKLPGTEMKVEKLTPQSAGAALDTVFGTGGLVLSQVTALTGIELYTVQNWVKRGFVSSPVSKKYSKRQFCRLVIINLLKDCLPIGEITSLLSYVNGSLSDESDDTVGDDELYMYFISMLTSVKGTDEEAVRECAKRVTESYEEPTENARERLCTVLRIMYYAYMSARLFESADELIHKHINKQ